MSSLFKNWVVSNTSQQLKEFFKANLQTQLKSKDILVANYMLRNDKNYKVFVFHN